MPSNTAPLPSTLPSQPRWIYITIGLLAFFALIGFVGVWYLFVKVPQDNEAHRLANLNACISEAEQQFSDLVDDSFCAPDKLDINTSLATLNLCNDMLEGFADTVDEEKDACYEKYGSD